MTMTAKVERLPETGRPGGTDGHIDFERMSVGMGDLWRRASLMNDERSAEEIARDGEWVPWRAIVVRDDVLPRTRLSDEAIEQYKLNFSELPPIKVQRGTFVLIGGRHRLAAAEGVSDFIRIVELDVPDEQLWLEAFRDNRSHGVPLTAEERQRAARRLFMESPELSDSDIGTVTGVSRVTVWRWRNEGKAEPQNGAEPQQGALSEADGGAVAPDAARIGAAPTTVAPPATATNGRAPITEKKRQPVEQLSFVDQVANWHEQVGQLAERLSESGSEIDWMTPDVAAQRVVEAEAMVEVLRGLSGAIEPTVEALERRLAVLREKAQEQVEASE